MQHCTSLCHASNTPGLDGRCASVPFDGLGGPPFIKLACMPATEGADVRPAYLLFAARVSAFRLAKSASACSKRSMLLLLLFSLVVWMRLRRPPPSASALSQRTTSMCKAARPLSRSCRAPSATAGGNMVRSRAMAIRGASPLVQALLRDMAKRHISSCRWRSRQSITQPRS